MSNNFATLSEGYDFIEESTPFSNEPLFFEETKEMVISEASNHEKSPYKILGRVCGCFAPVAAYSRNKRIYEQDHWDYVLQDLNLQERLKNRRIFGELGHQDKKIDDCSNRAGDISHIVTKMEVREDKNGTPFLYGEFEILDTPAGKILEAMYKGGAGLFVSSRAAGKLRPMEGNPGMNVVCKESYYLHSWDVVLEPGYLQARPTFEAVDTEPKVVPIIQESVVSQPLTQQPEQPVAVSVEPTILATSAQQPLEQSAQQPLEQPQTIIAFNPVQPILEQPANESEVAKLTDKVEQLARIIEKVVDDMYEVDEEAPVEETQVEDNVPTKESLVDFVKLMADTNISEEAFNGVLDIILGEMK